MVDPKTVKFEADGLSEIRREVVETAKALKRLDDLYKEASRRGGRIAQNARNLIEQQRLQVRERGLGLQDVRERFEATETGPERERLGRRLQRGALGIRRIAAKAETVAGQAGFGGGRGRFGKVGQFLGQMGKTMGGGGFMAQIGGALGKGGPLIGAAIAAGLALKKLASSAKQASDMYVKHMTSQLVFARSLTGNQKLVERFMDFDKAIGGEMRRFGFARPQTLQFGQVIAGIGGMTGRSLGDQFANLAEDITGGARISKFLGIRGAQGANLIGQARRAGITGGGVGEFLGGLGERAREAAPALRGRTGEFLSQALEYLKNISTTLDKSEKRDAVNFFTRVMGGLAKKGAEFTGAGMKQMFQSVDAVLQSGQGIIGGTFGRFLTSTVSGKGGTQLDVLQKLDQGIFADQGKVFQDMLKQMKASSGSLDNVAVILAGETKRKFVETKAFLDIVEGLDLETEGGLAEFRKRAAAFDPQMEADKLQAARAKQTDAMLKFGEAVPIFRAASLLMGDVAGLMLRDDREDFMQKFTGDFGFVDKASQKVVEGIAKRFGAPGGGEERGFGGFRGMMGMQLSTKLNRIFKAEEGSAFTPTGNLKLGFSKFETKRLATQMGFATSAELGKSAEFQLFIQEIKEFIAERTLSQPQKITLNFIDKDGAILGAQEIDTEGKD